MECKLVVGQKVVCVDNTPLPGIRVDQMDGLELGRVYTIREVIPDVKLLAPHFRWSKPGVTLVEIVRAPQRKLRDGPYYAHRFEPLVEHEVDISVFTELLKFDKILVDA